MEPKPRIIATVINDVVFDQRMIRICTSLSKNFDVQLWGRKKSSDLEEKRPYKQVRKRFLLNSGPLFYFSYNVRLFVRLIFTKFDILHAVDLDTLPACYIAARIKGKTIVYDSHEYFTEVPELVNRTKVRAIWLFIEKLIIPRLKYCITVGSKIAKQYEGKYNVPFTVVRNCPILVKEKSTDIPTENYLIYQGALNEGRGLETLIRAMKSIDMELKIAGAGDIEDELKELVEEEGLKNKVTFLGLIKPNQLLEITQKAFAGINVSENLGMSYYLSLNNKFFDYIHAGIPSITNSFPEYIYLNEKYNCCVMCECSEHQIVESVNLLRDDKIKYRELKKNCLLAREELNWHSEEKELLKLYAKIH